MFSLLPRSPIGVPSGSSPFLLPDVQVVPALTVSGDVNDLVDRVLVRIFVEFLDFGAEVEPAVAGLVEQAERVGEEIVAGGVERGRVLSFSRRSASA
jgi:hypothetical protein